MHRLRGLYAIADTCSINTDYLLNKVAEALSAGVTIIQFRDKKNNYDTRHKIASELKILTAKHQALLIINDDILIAKSIDADGVHLGKEDCSITEARKFLGPNKIIGASCYNCYANASKAVGAGANYVAFGSFFDSPTKPSAPRASIELITRAKKELSIPVCAIGGITTENVIPILNAGVDMIAVISAIFTSTSITQAVQEYLALLQQFDLTA